MKPPKLYALRLGTNVYCRINLSKHWFRCLAASHTYLNAARIGTVLRKKDIEKLVKVAILDTGIDLTHPLIKPFVEKGQIPKRWDYTNDSADIIDTDGHGTSVSHLLLKTAPYAMLYPMKVLRGKTAESNTPQLIQKVGLSVVTVATTKQRVSCLLTAR